MIKEYNIMRMANKKELSQNELFAIASRKIVNISFLEACMPMINDLSNRKKLPQNVRKPLNRVYEQHYKVHGELTLNDSKTFKVQNVLTNLLHKEMNRMKDSFDDGGNMSLEQYLLIGIELLNPLMRSIMQTDTSDLVSRTKQAEILNFTPMINSINSFVNAGNKYLYKSKYEDKKQTYKVGKWAYSVIKMYSEEVFKDIVNQSKVAEENEQE